MPHDPPSAGSHVYDAIGSDDVVELSGVTRQFDHAGGVADLDLHVPRGRIVGLIGPSGSGKTTTVRLILGIDRPQAGAVRVLGRDPTRLGRDDHARLGYLPQQTSLYEALSLQHNLEFMASLYGMPWRGRFWPKGRRGKQARRRVRDVMEMLDLQDAARIRLRDVSGGEQRRLSLAAAMVHEPDLLVLDEPTSGIDPVLRKDLWAQFARLRDQGVTLLVTTQYVEEAGHCDFIAMLVDGRVLAFDTPDGLHRRAVGTEAPADVSYDEVFVRILEAHRAGT